MSEPASDTTAPETTQTPDPAAQPPETDWKAEARKWEQRAKENFAQIAQLKPQADQFRQLEEASKSEAQRLAEAAETAKRDAEQARAEAIRYKAAATYGVPSEHFDLLGSGTEEEISARAEKIRALLAAQAAAATPPPASTPPTRPVEQLRPGATPSQSETEEDVIFASLFGKPA